MQKTTNICTCWHIAILIIIHILLHNSTSPNCYTINHRNLSLCHYSIDNHRFNLTWLESEEQMHREQCITTNQEREKLMESKRERGRGAGNQTRERQSVASCIYQFSCALQRWWGNNGAMRQDMTRPAASFGAWQTMMPQQQPQQHGLTNSEDGRMQHEAGNKRQARQHEASLCSTCNTCRSAGGQVQRKLRAARRDERQKKKRLR